jgi:hypothetical protein
MEVQKHRTSVVPMCDRAVSDRAVNAGIPSGARESPAGARGFALRMSLWRSFPLVPESRSLR